MKRNNILKKSVCSLLILLVVIVTLYFNFKEKKVVVLAYHKVVPKEIKEKYYKDNQWVDTTERFEQQMKYISDMKYTTLSMDEYWKWRNNKRKIPTRTVVITIDDGDLGVYYEMMPILKRYNLKATYFMIGDEVKNFSEKYDNTKKQYMGKDLIDKAKIEYPNVEIQSHSFAAHHHDNDNIPAIKTMNKEDILNDFDKMKFLNTNVYCYPYGEHTDTILEVLEEKNYKMAFKLDKSAISSRKDNKYLIPRVTINYNTSYLGFKKWLFKGIVM